MLLNLLHVESMRVEELLRRSFAENSSFLALFNRKNRLRQLQADLDKFAEFPCNKCGKNGIEDYFAICSELAKRFRTGNSDEKQVATAGSGGISRTSGSGGISGTAVTVGSVVIASTEENPMIPGVVLRAVDRDGNVELLIAGKTPGPKNSLAQTFALNHGLKLPRNDSKGGENYEIRLFNANDLLFNVGKSISLDIPSIREDWEDRKQPKFRFVFQNFLLFLKNFFKFLSNILGIAHPQGQSLIFFEN